MDIIHGVKLILPSHYDVSETKGGIRCKSEKGMDEEIFQTFFEKVKSWFGKSFQEVYHEICYRHKDFIVYYKTNN